MLVSGNADKVITIREDPQRGVFVNSNENVATDFESFLGFFAGEKKRSVASTSMNERSSLSHTIFWIIVESRKISSESKDSETESNSNEENNSSKEKPSEEDDGAVHILTLNLVDLSGSENFRHTGSTWDRQKEGGQINRRRVYISHCDFVLVKK